MKTLKLFSLAIFMLMAISSMTGQTNLVVNGGFEQAAWVDGTKAQEWSFATSGGETQGWAVTTTNGIVPPEGTKMAYVKCLLPTTYIFQTLFKLTSGVGVTLKSGSQYTLQFKAYSVPGTVGNVPVIAMSLYSLAPYFHYYKDGNTYFDVPAGSWQTFSYTFTVSTLAADGTDVSFVLGVGVKGNIANTIFYFDDFSIIEQTVATSLNNTKSEAAFLSPSPVIDRCKVNNGEFKSAKVYDLAGTMVLNSRIDSNNEIDMSNLKSGYYSVVLKGNTQKTFKVIKK